MKKMISVVLAILFICSCVATMVVNTSARVETPNGRTEHVANTITGAHFLTHRMFDSYFVAQECFLIRGRVEYQTNPEDYYDQIQYSYNWKISYTSGVVEGREDPIEGVAIPDSSWICEYVNTYEHWNSYRVVSKIETCHELYVGDNDESVTELKTIYTPN